MIRRYVVLSVYVTGYTSVIRAFTGKEKAEAFVRKRSYDHIDNSISYRIEYLEVETE